jgi:hypothetical protein
MASYDGAPSFVRAPSMTAVALTRMDAPPAPGPRRLLTSSGSGE